MRMIFTYGNADIYPYKGGWTEIIAPTTRLCIDIFRAYHPDRTPGILNCADYYSFSDFRDTEMYRDGNFGKRRHEKITVMRMRTYPERDERRKGAGEE